MPMTRSTRSEKAVGTRRGRNAVPSEQTISNADEPLRNMPLAALDHNASIGDERKTPLVNAGAAFARSLGRDVCQHLLHLA